MASKASQQIEKIKKSNWPYPKKSTICKLEMVRHEAFGGEWEEAEEFCKLAIHYESLFSWPGQKIEVDGLKRHLKSIQKKRRKAKNV